METAEQKSLVQGVSSGCYWMFTLLKHWAFLDYCIICVCVCVCGGHKIKKKGWWIVTVGAKGVVCVPEGAWLADSCALIKLRKCHTFLPSPIHACPHHGPWATS